MSPGGRSERVERLRAEIARLETDGAARFPAGAPRRVALGRDLSLDRVLRGGLLRGGLTEVVPARPADAGAASGFALALAARFAHTGGTILWIVEDGAAREDGLPYLPGLRRHGLDDARLLVVRTPAGTDTLWAMEEALKCRALAVVLAELRRTKSYDLVASRRLVLAAARGGTPGVLLATGAPGGAASLSSAAQVRFEIGAGTSPVRPAADPRRPPLPGPAAWHVRLARIRAGPTGAAPFDWTRLWPLVWDHEEARFCDALPLSAPALPRDGSHPAAARVA